MNTDHFDDIEQMLKPQCEFKASESLKQNVMAKARQEVCPHRTIRLWPWVAAACVAGFLMLYFMPPETAPHDAALHARLVKAYQTDRQQTAYVRTSDFESFDVIEHRMKSRGEQIKEEIENLRTYKMIE